MCCTGLLDPRAGAVDPGVRAESAHPDVHPADPRQPEGTPFAKAKGSTVSAHAHRVRAPFASRIDLPGSLFLGVIFGGVGMMVPV